MARTELTKEQAQERIGKARYKVTVIFPEGRPLAGWAMLVRGREAGMVQLYEFVAEIPMYAGNTVMEVNWTLYDLFSIAGGMVTWFPLGKAGDP